MKYIYLCVALLTLSACTVVEPYVAEYRIKPEQTNEKFAALACRDKSLKVSQAFSQNALMTQKMKYAQNKYGEFAFSESEWSRSPNNAITQEILKSVRETKLFQSVQSYKSRTKSDYILESDIEEFMQYFDDDLKNSYVKVTMAFTLVDAKSSKAVDTLTLSKRVQTKKINAQGGVEALNIALGEILIEKNRWLNEVCK